MLWLRNTNPVFWLWNAILRRYYLTSEGARALGGRAGQFVGAAAIRGVRDGIVEKSQQRMESIVTGYLDGRIGIDVMVKQMRNEIKNTAVQQWLLSSGGKEKFTHSDAGKLGNWLRQEYSTIQGLATKIANGEITPGQAKLYARYQSGYTGSLFERAAANSRGVDLPAYPTQTTCGANCRCAWRWIDEKDRWLVVWEMSSGAKHCPDCLSNASRWSMTNPLVIMKPMLER